MANTPPSPATAAPFWTTAPVWTTRAPTPSAANVRQVAGEFPDKKVLLLGCGDSYVQLAAHCRDQLPDNVIAPYIDGALLDTLINKEKFYQLCDRYGIDHPATFIYDKSMGHDLL